MYPRPCPIDSVMQVQCTWPCLIYLSVLVQCKVVYIHSTWFYTTLNLQSSSYSLLYLGMVVWIKGDTSSRKGHPQGLTFPNVLPSTYHQIQVFNRSLISALDILRKVVSSFLLSYNPIKLFPLIVLNMQLLRRAYMYSLYPVVKLFCDSTVLIKTLSS